MNWVRGVTRNLASKCAVALVVTLGFTSQSWAIPVNDLIGNAILLPPGNGSVIGTTTGATTDTGAPFAGTAVTSPGVWYTAFGSGAVIGLDTYSIVTNYDSKISVYSDFAGTLAGLTPIGGNDDGAGAPPGCALCSAFAFPSDAGTQYWILVHGFGGDSGDFGLNYTNLGGEVSAVPLPAAFPLFAAALGLLGFFGWRRKGTVAA